MKIKIRISKSHDIKTVPMGMFVEVSGKILAFLEEACDSLGIEVNICDWAAGSFVNKSIGYQLEGFVNEQEELQLIGELESIMELKSNLSMIGGGRSNVLNKYLDIADSFTNGGEVKIGIRGSGRRRFKYHILNAKRALQVKQSVDYYIANIDNDIVYYGAVKGLIYTWHKEGTKPYVEIKDVNRNDLIRCYYLDDLYHDIYTVLNGKNNQVVITGEIIMSRKENKINSMKAKKFEVLKQYEYREGDIDKFIGCAKGITKGKSAREYIERIRDEGE